MNFVQTTTAPVAALTGPAGSLVLPLLRCLGNGRGKAVIGSAVPDPETPLTLGALGTTLARLGYDISYGARAKSRWRQPIDGAVVVAADDGAVVAFARQAGRTLAIAPTPDGIAVPPTAEADPAEVAARLARAATVLHVRQVFAVPLTEFDEDLRHVLTAGFAVSLFINLIALAIPFLTMVVYDRVIGGTSPEALPGLAMGGLIVVAIVLGLRRARARLLAAAHARFGHALETRAAQRVMRAPVAVTGQAAAHVLLERIQQAWRVVDPLGHALSTALFDAPFILLSLVAIACVGGLIVLVPILYLGVFLAIAVLLDHRSRTDLQLAAAAAAEREAMLAELADKAEDLRLAGLEDAWLNRFAEVSRRTAAAAVQTGTRAAFTQAVAHVLGTGVALATLATGVGLVLGGSMSAGGLIATMLLVWRITGPAQALFFSLGRLRQARGQRARLEALLQTPAEADPQTRMHNAKRNVPTLRFDRVSYRHPTAAEPALSGVSFAMEPGEVVAVLGPTGCGKSTVLDIAAGLLTPQAGAVLVDGENLAHIDPDDYRLTVAAHAPARPHVFNVPARENIALAAPWIETATLDDTVLDGDRLALARLASRPPRIAVLDMPANGEDGAARFAAFVERMRGSGSVVFSTADPAVARMADKVLVLDAGRAIYFGPPAPVATEVKA